MSLFQDGFRRHARLWLLIAISCLAVLMPARPGGISTAERGRATAGMDVDSEDLSWAGFRTDERAVDVPPIYIRGVPSLRLPEFVVDVDTSVCDKWGPYVDFQQDVTCTDVGKIGVINFDFYLCTGTDQVTVRPDSILPDCSLEDIWGGAILVGGFKPEDNCVLDPRWTWCWVQAVKADDPITDTWVNNTAKDWYIDTKTRTDPCYPYDWGTWTEGYYAGGKSFGDLPHRDLDTKTAWKAELALVCVKRAANEGEKDKMKIVCSFDWGFEISLAGAMYDNPQYGRPRNFREGATDNFIQTVKKDWYGDDFKDWEVTEECCCTLVTPVEKTSWGVIKAIYR